MERVVGLHDQVVHPFEERIPQPGEALKVAEGATNREAASALFLSPKTVEAHLSRIYSKLGIRSRTELAHRFTQESSVAPAVTPTSRR